MLRIMLFNQTDNLYEQGLTAFEEAIIVAPSPQIADIIRRKLANRGSNVDVLTISKFLKDELSILVGQEVSQNYRGKSDLLLLLSTLWKKLGLENPTYELFQRCFHLLTDLRSFSMSNDVLETALEHFDESIAFGTMRMHQILNQLDIYDEHRSYFQLSEVLRSGDIPIDFKTERNIVFLGFDFLSASQVDLLRSYSIRDNIVLPVFQRVYENLSDWDWLSWLDSEQVEKDYLDEERPTKRIGLATFPKNYLSKSLKEVLATGPNKLKQIILGDRHPNFEKLQQANLSSSKFKSSVDILSDKVNWLMDLISKEGYETTEDLLASLDELTWKCVETQDFRGIKAIQLLQGVVKEWRELSDDNEVVSSFDLKIFKETLSLDAPRVSKTTLSKNGFDVEIKSLKELEDIARESFKVFCVTSEFTSPKGSLTTYTEGVEKYLSSIGPLRRAELEYVALREKILDVLDDDSVALVEDGVLDRDQNWKDLFDHLEVEKMNFQMSFEKNTNYFPVPKAQTINSFAPFSSTKVQTYIDCPQKFFYKYGLKFSPDYTYQDRMQNLELGRVQHKTIEDYVNNYSHYSEVDHKALIETLLQKALIDKSVTKASVADYKHEIFNLTQVAIEQLIRIKSNSEFTVKFEQEILDHNFRGSIDCVIETDGDIFLLDFKRGKGSIPSQKGFKAFEKIQLWFYSNHWKLSSKNLCLGYICLSEIEESTLYFSSGESKDKFKGIFGAKAISIEKDFDELFDKYMQFEQSTIAILEADTSFKPIPQSAKICDYCDFNKTCSRAGGL